MFWVGFVCMLFKHDLKFKKSQVNKSFFYKKVSQSAAKHTTCSSAESLNLII